MRLLRTIQSLIAANALFVGSLTSLNGQGTGTALTQFPSVLDNLAKNLAWTSSLGGA